MKQFFALLVLVSFFAYGQHTNVVYQDGQNNDSYVTQEFVGSGTYYQGNEAYVTQLGNTNYSDVYQANNGYAGSKEWAQVLQDGNDNIATVDQLNDGHTAAITSLGNNNKAYSFQNGNKTDAVIYQDGNGNYGKIHIMADDQTPHTFAHIYQYGQSNTAYQTIGDGWTEANGASSFHAYQEGNDNFSKQTMEADMAPGGVDDVDNHGVVTQDGNNNYGLQEMKIGGAGFDCAGNDAVLFQNGNNNISKQYQDRNDNASTVTQLGNGNYSISIQN